MKPLENHLRGCALNVAGQLPLGKSDALAVIDMLRQLVEWRDEDGSLPEPERPKLTVVPFTPR